MVRVFSFVSPQPSVVTMLHLEPSHSPIRIPLFLWETILNCTCFQLYTDESALSTAVIEQLEYRVPIVLYNKAEGTSALFKSCNILAVAENVSTFTPPTNMTFMNILITAENSNDTSNLHRYTRKIFFWISGIASQPIIRSFDTNGDLEVISVNKFRGIIRTMSSNSLVLPNFKGKKIFMSLANHTVYSLIGRRNTNEPEWISGLEYDAIEFACSILNLTKIIKPENEVGELLKGNATGIIADVIHDRTDIGFGGIWLDAEIASNVEYINPYGWRCGQYLVPRPSLVVNKSNLILLPFEESLWLTVGAAILVASSIKTVFARFFDEGSGRRYESFKWSLYTTIMHLILRYYPNENENRGVMRHLFVSWSWLSFVLVTLYSSQLAAILVTPRYEDKPQTVVDFYKKGFYWGGPTSSPPHSYQASFSPVYGPLWRKERFLREDSADDRNARMEKGMYVVRGESVDHNYFFFNDHHMPRDDIVKNYEAAGQCYANFYTAPIFPRGSPYSVLFNRVYSLMREFGIQKKRKKTSFSTKPVKDFVLRNVFFFTKSNKTREFIPVNLSLVSSPFILLFIGHCMGAVMFLAHYFYYIVTRNNCKRLATRKRKVNVITVRRLPYNN